METNMTRSRICIGYADDPIGEKIFEIVVNQHNRPIDDLRITYLNKSGFSTFKTAFEIEVVDIKAVDNNKNLQKEIPFCQIQLGKDGKHYLVFGSEPIFSSILAESILECFAVCSAGNLLLNGESLMAENGLSDLKTDLITQFKFVVEKN